MAVKKEIKITVAITLFLLLAGFAFYQANHRSLNKIIVQINDVSQQAFITEEDVLGLLKDDSLLINRSLAEIDLKAVEEKVKQMPFVAECQVARDLKGNLLIDIIQNRPLARLIRPKGAGQYLAENGQLMPLSPKYTARVLLISGEKANGIVGDYFLTDVQGKEIFSMLQFIEKESFWKAQIAQVDIDKNGQL
ncbi:MAG: hypothetical protein RL065_721, partial [Bacteroidota bacterium]